jgi:Domain of Unknown Function (DUF1080)
MKRTQVSFFAKTKFLSIMKEEITMKRLSVITIGLLVIGVSVFGCSQQMSGQGDAGWVTLLYGSNPKTLDNWNRLGDANWRVEDGAVVADKGKGGHLVSKSSYKDFQIRAEFWADILRTAAFSSALPIPKLSAPRPLTR